MALLAAAAVFLGAQAALRGLVRATLGALWAELDPDDLSGSWDRLRAGERAFVTISAYQSAAVADAGDWVLRAITEQGGDASEHRRVNPRMIAGRSSDGGLLEPRLYTPIVNAKRAIARRTPPDRAVRAAGLALQRIGASEVADASRAATTAATTVEPDATGWVRLVRLPACGRCVTLAEQRFEWDSPVRAHKNCDCLVVPAVGDGADDLRTDPRAYFESLAPEDQAERFGAVDAERIRAGTSPAAAVGLDEARSGLAVVGDPHPGAPGPTVRSLLVQARGDRDTAIRLLNEHGFTL